MRKKDIFDKVEPERRFDERIVSTRGESQQHRSQSCDVRPLGADLLVDAESQGSCIEHVEERETHKDRRIEKSIASGPTRDDEDGGDVVRDEWIDEFCT